MTLTEWRRRHGARALRQGWSIFESGTHGLEIERDDSANVFERDEDAVEYVRRQAQRGCPGAIEALKLTNQ